MTYQVSRVRAAPVYMLARCTHLFSDYAHSRSRQCVWIGNGTHERDGEQHELDHKWYYPECLREKAMDSELKKNKWTRDSSAKPAERWVLFKCTDIHVPGMGYTVTPQLHEQHKIFRSAHCDCEHAPGDSTENEVGHGRAECARGHSKLSLRLSSQGLTNQRQHIRIWINITLTGTRYIVASQEVYWYSA